MTENTHVLVPEQRILSTEEKTQLLQELSLNAVDLPKIDSTDAGIKELSPENGDIVEIIKISKNAGRSKYYRVVING